MGAAANSADQLVITVTDTGYGIDADALPKIFQPFFTAKKRRGLGLGLTICDRIIKAHGGRIDVESVPGQGTTFRIHLSFNQPAARRSETVDDPNRTAVFGQAMDNRDRGPLG